MLSVAIDSFSYDRKQILSNIHFQLKPGEHLSVLGESGCGKSTLLHLIYGLLPLKEGSLSWSGDPLKGPEHSLIPGHPFMKLVAQEYNIMPYISVSENIATHLSRLDAEEDQQRIHTLLHVVDLWDERDTHVQYLSGGQKQRVVLAKALANTPELLLLDEPFSHIDTFRKNGLRRKLFRYLKENQISCITATHDAEEALAFSDTILLLNEGSLFRLGTPQSVFKESSTPYELGFFGEVSQLKAGLVSEKTTYALPHQLTVTTEKTDLKVRVETSYFKGSHYMIQAEMKGETIFFDHHQAIELGRTIYLAFEER